MGTLRRPNHVNGGDSFIISPDYPNQYPDDIVCNWNISVPCQGVKDISDRDLPGIRIDFDIFQLKSRDALDIKIGKQLIRRLQGKGIQQPYITNKEHHVEYEIITLLNLKINVDFGNWQ